MAIAVDSIRSGTNARDAFEPLDIAVDRCKGCGLCVSICPKNVLMLDVSIVNRARLSPGSAD